MKLRFLYDIMTKTWMMLEKIMKLRYNSKRKNIQNVLEYGRNFV